MAALEHESAALLARASRRGASRPARDPALSRGAAVPTLSGPLWTHFQERMAAAQVIAFVKDLAGRYIYANAYMLAATGDRMGPDWHGKTDAEIWPADFAALLRANDEAVLRSRALGVFAQVTPLADGPHTFLVMKFPLPSDGGRVDLGGIGVDITEHVKSGAERNELTAAIEQAAESVVITDRDAVITYVNPAFERVTGYLRDEVIGKNPRLLKSGFQPRSFYEAMWAGLARGTPWVADFVNRHKDGSLFTEEAVISPIRDASGDVTSYVAVKRDVTHERALEQRSTQLTRERASIAETIRGLGGRDSPEATAQAICRQVMSLTGVTAAQLFVFELDGRAMPAGFAVVGRPDPPLKPLTYQRSRHLRVRAAEGPWIEPWVGRLWHPYTGLLNGLDVHSVACAPVRHDGRLIGLLVIDAADAVDMAALTEDLPALVEFADLAGALIGREVADRGGVRRGRERIMAVIERRAFHPVFQPIVDLANDAVVGFEALTRFADGARPEIRFGAANVVGLGTELETAALRAAVAAAGGLPGSAWLNLNVSPELILAGEPLRALVAGCPRPVVLEVTEHAAVADYPAFRAAMAELGPKVRLAVDDAGAGFASLRHILELRPAFVKLDRWLVAGLESDDARQAMIVGLRHFARSTGCRLIAEGIETDRELAVLRSLDIPLGQGFLLGRPLPIAAVLVAVTPKTVGG